MKNTIDDVGNGASPKSEVTWMEPRGAAVVVRNVKVPAGAPAAIANVTSVTGYAPSGTSVSGWLVPPRSPDCPFAVVVVIKPGSAPAVELNENGSVPMLLASVNVKYVRPVIVINGAIKLEISNQYDRPYEPGPNPE